jgi:hypothetical protein
MESNRDGLQQRRGTALRMTALAWVPRRCGAIQGPSAVREKARRFGSALRFGWTARLGFALRFGSALRFGGPLRLRGWLRRLRREREQLVAELREFCFEAGEGGGGVMEIAVAAHFLEAAGGFDAGGGAEDADAALEQVRGLGERVSVALRDGTANIGEALGRIGEESLRERAHERLIAAGGTAQV